MVIGLKDKVFQNEKVEALKNELKLKFEQDLKSGKKEIDVLLYILDEDFICKSRSGDTIYSYTMNENLLKSRFPLEGSLKRAVNKRYVINNSRFANFKDLLSCACSAIREENQEEKVKKFEKFVWHSLDSNYSVRVDDLGVKCVFAKVKLSNKMIKKLRSEKYCLDFQHLYNSIKLDENKIIYDVQLITLMLLRYKS